MKRRCRYRQAIVRVLIVLLVVSSLFTLVSMLRYHRTVEEARDLDLKDGEPHGHYRPVRCIGHYDRFTIVYVAKNV